MEVVKIKLEEISGVHDGLVRLEHDLDIEPVEIPDQALIPKNRFELVSETYPLTVVKAPSGSYVCVGQVTLYRWMKAHLKGEREVSCMVQRHSFVQGRVKAFFMLERTISPALSKIEPYASRALYEYILLMAKEWVHEYKNYAHFSK